MSVIVFRDVNKHFADEMGSKGPWKSWSKFYSKRMDEIGRGGNKKLQFDGTLRQTFKPTNTRASNKGILWFNDARTRGGFPYAYAHDEGGPQLPKRDFMWLSKAAMDDISKNTLAFMLDKGI